MSVRANLVSTEAHAMTSSTGERLTALKWVPLFPDQPIDLVLLEQRDKMRPNAANYYNVKWPCPGSPSLHAI